MNRFSQIFFKGIAIVLPFTITILVLKWLVVSMESILSSLMRFILGESYYIPGMGLATILLIIFIVGLLGSNFLTNRLILWFTDFIEKIPGVKTVYGPIKDLMGFFDKRNQKNQRVVMIHDNHEDSFIIGIVTRDQFSDLPSDLFREDYVSVYIPFSYMMGGVTKLVDKKKLVEVDMPVDQALKLAITGWLKIRD